MKNTLKTLIPIFLSICAAHADILSVDQYLEQVKKQNTGYTGAVMSSMGALEHSNEGNLLVQPMAFADLQYTRDNKIPSFPGFVYSRFDTQFYDLGVSETTTFGLQARLYYAFDYNGYVNLLGAGGSVSDFSFWEARPVIELRQDLWGNGFGRSTRAQQELLQAQALSSHYANSFQARVTLTDAEAAYWRLSIARQIVHIQQDAQDRAQKIYDWNVKRAKLHLGDEADALQALAALKTRKLELQASFDDLRTASRGFNVGRNVDSDDVREELTAAKYEVAERLTIPKRAEMREDTKAAQQNSLAQEANATVSIEKDKPTLQLFASYALNGHDSTLPPSMSNSFSSGRPTESVGVKFSAPLDFGLVSNAQGGWKKEREGAELSFQKKAFDDQQNWIDLNERFTEAKRRLDFSREIESVQFDKLTYEKDRLRKGRSTTYQVLLFESDYILAQGARVHAEADVFSYYTQLKLFGESL